MLALLSNGRLRLVYSPHESARADEYEEAFGEGLQVEREVVTPEQHARLVNTSRTMSPEEQARALRNARLDAKRARRIDAARDWRLVKLASRGRRTR